ncbi:MAG: DUF4198 domain-containing protein [Pseudomonadota bacterium]
MPNHTNRSSRQYRHLALTGVFSLLLLTATSHAHVQWLAPNFNLESGESAWLSFDHAFSDRRFIPSSGPSSYYVWWIVGPDGFKKSIPHLFLGKTRTVGEIELTDPGTYRLEAIEDRMAWTKIKLNEKEQWQPGSRDAFSGHEVVSSRLYFQKSVSYVSLGSLTKSVLKPTGDPIEIVFDQHPNDLHADKDFVIRVLSDGAPLADQDVLVYAEGSDGHDATSTCTTNALGRCELTLATAGRYLLTTNTEGDYAEGASTDGYTYTYSVVIEALPK